MKAVAKGRAEKAAAVELGMQAGDEVGTILAALGLPDGRREEGGGVANEVVLTPAHAVRLNSGRFSGAFRHEAGVLAMLPSSVPHAQVAGIGERPAGRGEYLVLTRLPGRSLADAWPDLSPARLRHVGAQVGRIVATLHALPAHEQMRCAWADDAVGPGGDPRDAYHAPPAAVGVLAEAARTCTDDAVTVDEAAALVTGRLTDGAFPSDEAQMFCHLDLHAGNIIVEGDAVTGLVDFEGSRPATPDTDLDMLLRSLRARTGGRAFLRGFASAYPKLVEGPRLLDRLEAYEVLWQLVQLLHWEPGATWAPDPRGELRAVFDGRWRREIAALLGGPAADL